LIDWLNQQFLQLCTYFLNLFSFSPLIGTYISDSFSQVPVAAKCTTTCRVCHRTDKTAKQRHWASLCNTQGSCPFVKIKFKDFSRTFKNHTKDI